jgi:uncharacterized protein (TIGR03437 family)
VLFNPAVIAGLAPNTYNGTIAISPVPSGQSPSVVVPLVLTVLPTPPVTVNPQSLSFNWQTGIAAPNPSQSFTIATTSAQPLSYSFNTSVDTGNWISTLSPPSGTFTTSTPITLTLNPNGLAVGTYNGKLTLFTPGGTPTQQDIPVRLVVSNTPLLNVPNATLNFAYQLGTTAPPAQTVNITATSGTLTYAVTPSANSPWLSVPNSGVTGTPLSVSINPAGLTAGTYSATINVVSATPGSLAQPIPVQLKVTNDPVISTSINALSFSYQIGQAAPGSRNVKITSSTGVPLNYTATVDLGNCSANWLQLNGGGGTASGVTDGTLTVVPVVTSGFSAAGTCVGTVTIAATNPATGAAAVGSPISIGVTLYASTTAQLLLTPPEPPVFTVGIGTQSPPPQNIILTSTDSTVLNYTVAFQSSTGNWLFAGPQSGSTANNNVLTISAIPSGLTAGTYTGTVTVTASGPGGAAVANSPIAIPVKLVVTAVSLTVSNSDLSFEQTLGGPLPATQSVALGSTGQTLNYTAVANSNSSVNWLAVSPASGTTGGSLTVSVDGTQLIPGTTYNGTIVVTAPGAGNSPYTINVHLKVNPGTISAPTTTLTFTQAAGGAAPPAQTIAVTGSPAALNFTVTSSTQNGVNWLGATPASGTTPGTIQVVANGPTLGVGQYTGTVTIASSGAAGSPISVPVVLNVVTPATLAVTPTSLSFTYVAGQPVPAAQSLAVSSAGAVPFTTQVQIDGTATGWLSVTPASGNTPAGLSVSVSPTALAAGNYTGRIVITSPNAIAALTVPVTLAVVTIPKPVIVAVKNAANYFSGNLSPGENILIGGAGLGPVTLTLGAIVNNSYTTIIANTRVLFDNVPAPIIYVSDSLTSVMVPYGVAGRTSTSIVVEYFGVQSAPAIYNLAPASPGIYTLNSSGSGPAAILNQNGSVNGPNAPEKRGNVIAVYMTGEGATTPAGIDGAIIPPVASALKKPLLTVTATIGGIAADVQYAGSAPGLVSGVMQVNLLIPANAPVGANVPIVVNVGTASSAGAGAPTVAIQ